jgi:lipopolysaccharide biosynthesis glycosyltransferase
MQPINIYYSIDVNVYDQVLLSIISLIKTNPNNTLHIYLLSHKYKLKTISKKELNLLRTIIKQGSKDNKIFIVDVTELMTKYMLTGPNEHWEDTDHFVKNYKHISLLYVRFLIVFIPNVPKKIL